MRALAVDFGGKRIGIATGTTDHKIASPRLNIQASGTLAKDAEQITNLAKSEEVELIIVGLPLDHEGETKMSKICRMLGTCIEQTGFEVRYIDESFTSMQSERDMQEAGLKGSERRKMSDGEAACRILERFFEQEG